MIRYLIVLYLGLISLVLIDPNPLWSTPLVLVLIGLLWERRSVTLLGIITFSIVSVGHMSAVSLSDLPEVGLLSLALVLPLVLLLEISLSDRPYRVQRISLVPILVSLGMIAVFISTLFVLARFQRIGVYVSSDPLLQVFVLISLTIFLTGPVLLGSRPAEQEKIERSQNGQPSTIKTNK
ncbi:MAG: hypothetical protein ACMUHY_00830 [Thermoplasmatota archaeon]